jgi:predicted GIY-YIG superfamily endonuclease
MPAPERTALYRFYSADQTLLYVGISNNPMRRETSHHSRAEWIHLADLTRTTVEWYDDREAALDAEGMAIREENPLYNRQRTAAQPRPKKVRSTVDLMSTVHLDFARRLHEAASELDRPRVTTQQYLSSLVAIAIQDDKVHEMVLDRIGGPLRRRR